MKCHIVILLTSLVGFILFGNTPLQGKDDAPPNLNAQLAKAASRGDRQRVVELLEAGAEVNARDARGKTALITVAYFGHKDIAKVLIAKGADVNAKDTRGETPLIGAAMSGRKEIVELLIAKGADVNARDRHGRTPLIRAATSGHEEIAKVLMAKGAAVDARDALGRTPLYFAAEQGRTEVVELLLASGANVNAESRGGTTPLHRACNLPSKRIAEILLKQGAKVNTRSNAGIAPLDVAAQFGRKDIAILLMAKGAELHKKDRFGRNSVYWAFSNWKVEMAEFLMSKGVKHDPPVRKRKFEPKPLRADDPRIRFISHFRDVLNLVSKNDVNGVFSKVADGHGKNSFRIHPGGAPPKVMSKAGRDPKKFMKRNFLFSNTILKNIENVSYAGLTTASETVTVTGSDRGKKLAATLYVIPVSIPGVTYERYDVLQFVEVKETLYWVPFGW